MSQYIDKDALVAEIDKRIKNYIILQQKPEMSDLQEELQYKIDCLNSIKGYIINTLEVKEVQEDLVSEDLEEAAIVYARGKYDRKNLASLPQKCIGCYAPIIYAFKSGAKWHKKQMMKDAFDAVVCKVGSTYLKEMDRDAIVKVLEPYKDRDKVKVIIKA